MVFTLRLRFYLCRLRFSSVYKIAGKIGQGVDEQIKQVDYDHTDRRGKRRADGGEEEGIQLEEHIVRADLGEIHKVCRHRGAEGGDGGEEKIEGSFRPFVGVIARSQHYQRAENDGTVVEEGVKAREGDTGVVAENCGGVDEIYGAAEKSKGADIAAAHISDLASAENGKGHSIHKDTTRIKGKDAAPLESDLSTRACLPDNLCHLKADDNCPKDSEGYADGLFALFGDEKPEEDDCRKNYCRENKMQRGEHRARDLVG